MVIVIDRVVVHWLGFEDGTASIVLITAVLARLNDAAQ